ncbi:FAD:protein FMN transferase [Comamonas sp. Y33R10-2]|uniref:FAD:protein FMN transferase n=1 Tax=Comamonas sp. Y33R10-2 TaxID=2853257 RepID=UPI001C5CB130|nr:FAD:protein FMN transferase [Comamonas sp. Y33R10-2]QXZ10596.1 FAD:protein FMN transferase [Comamonas sp. Y33R10-2]
MTSTPRVRFDASLWKLSSSAQSSAPSVHSAQPVNFAVQRWQSANLQHQQDGRIHRLAGETMGSHWSLRLANPDYLPVEPVQALLKQVFDEVIAQMSNWEADSVISRFNQSKPGQVHLAPREFAHVLDAALHWAKLSGAAMDPSMGALVSLWGFGPRQNPLQPHQGQTPAVEVIERLLQTSGYQHLDWNAQTQQLRQPGGLELDFCGIAKGFAVDWAVQKLQAAGWAAGLLEIGGELRTWGQRPDERAWQVQLGAGNGTTDAAQPLVVSIKDGAFATSGDLWHQFSVDGRRYSHTLDPRTGWPVTHDLASVTVFHPECMHADALATVLTVLGPQEGMDFARQHAIAAVLISHANETGASTAVLKTPAWINQFGA